MLTEIDQVIEQISGLKEVALPLNKTENRQLRLSIKSATPDQPVRFFVGSCPDYSHRSGLYTHEYLGEGVPLLTSYHLDSNTKLLAVLDEANVPYVFTIMVADVEATDEIFCQKFTGGDEDEFIRRCQASVVATKTYLAQKFSEFQGQLLSSSFFQQFGRERFMHHQYVYHELLTKRYEEDSSFSHRVDMDTYKRMNMYENMYRGVGVRGKFAERFAFYNTRTMRTMAQYLTLGRLIAEQGPSSVIINHPTRNISMFNDRNKFPLPEDGARPQPTIPIMQMKKEVYK